MEEGIPPIDQLEGIPAPEPVEYDLKDLHRQVKETERRWVLEGDSEALWEAEHALLIQIQAAGDSKSLMKRAGKANKAMKTRGSAADLAQASLSLWVLERYEEAEVLLRTAMDRLTQNRYPWSLLLRRLTWDRDPQEAMDFIIASLDTVPWRAYALVQLGTLCIDSASRNLKEGDLEACETRLGEARDYLDETSALEDCSEDMRRTAERLTLLVDTLGKRLDVARSVKLEEASEGPPRASALQRLELDVRDVAEASGVSLEGEQDEDLNLDELERIAFMETPEDEDHERTYTVLEVTPSEGRDRIRRKRED